MKWYPTSVIADALDKLGHHNRVLPRLLRSNFPCKIVGRARTISIVPCSDTYPYIYPSDIYHSLHFLEQLEEGDILFVSVAKSLRDYAFFGGLMTKVAQRAGVVAAIIDGVTRDREDTIKARFPVFARGVCGQDMKNRGTVLDVDIITEIGEAHVEVWSGDYIFGDMDGLIVVPYGLLNEVNQIAEQIEDTEEEVKELVLEGLSVNEIINECGEF